MNPSLRIDRNSPDEGLGYKLSDSDEAARRALKAAFDLVKSARENGAELRRWATGACERIGGILNENSHRRPAADPVIMKELMGWESDTLKRISSYIGNTTLLASEAKRLNPPLTMAQLKPFLDAITADRHTTMASLDPLTKQIEKIMRLKAESMKADLKSLRPAV